MEFSFLVPDIYTGLSELSHYQLVLPSYYVSGISYSNIHKAFRLRNHFSILDNGFHELQPRLVPWDLILPVAEDLQPNVIAVPEGPELDYSLLEDCIGFLNWFRKLEGGLPSEYMYVPKGMFLDEIAEELEFLKEIDEDKVISWIGLQKDLEGIAEGNLGGRRALMLAFEDYLKDYKIHMLGIYKNPIEEIKSFREFSNVIGCDSSKPWRIASHGRRLEEWSPSPPEFNFRQNGGVNVQFVAREFRKLLEVCHG